MERLHQLRERLNSCLHDTAQTILDSVKQASLKSKNCKEQAKSSVHEVQAIILSSKRIAHYVQTITQTFSHFLPPLLLFMTVGFATRLSFAIMPLFHKNLGDVWHCYGSTTLAKSNIRSTDATSSVRLCFRNQTTNPIVLCWVDEDGAPHHFYRLDATSNNIQQVVTKHDHIEHTKLGHAFCIYELCSDDDDDDDDLEGSTNVESKSRRLIGGYRPTRLGTDADHPCHIITIQKNKRQLRRQRSSFQIKVALGTIDPTPIDTTNKHYHMYHVSEWPVFCCAHEWNKLDTASKDALELDLQILQQCLPSHAAKALRPNTPLWINTTKLRYGPKLVPSDGLGACFHPDANWLKENGLHRQKVEGVELYSFAEYMRERDTFWKPGGLLIHEFAHAYHWKRVKDGYENADIKRCWEAAMKDNLYDCVKVHDLEGNATESRRAYACQDPMEYFAELSVAFLGGCGSNKDAEFNKWFPFNRKQLREHDPRAYEMLKRVWKVKDEDLEMCDE
jgi:hypothetical protein